MQFEHAKYDNRRKPNAKDHKLEEAVHNTQPKQWKQYFTITTLYTWIVIVITGFILDYFKRGGN